MYKKHGVALLFPNAPAGTVRRMVVGAEGKQCGAQDAFCTRYNSSMFPADLQTKYSEVTKFLTNAIQKSRLANSYVFIGKSPDDILKITKSLAKILNCKQNNESYSSPCEQCTNCKWIEKNEHPQAFITVSPDSESKKEQIKIENIRELLNTLNTTSEYFRVIYFQASGLQSLPPDSCNLLLKTVEETPGRTLFIFANQSRNDILGTILSRSQTIYINKKHDSVSELIRQNKGTLPEITECFPKNLLDSLEKAKNTHELIQKNEMVIKDYLINLATENYSVLKHKNQKQYCTLYKNISEAYSKSKAFIQPKIVLEDLFLNLIK